MMNFDLPETKNNRYATEKSERLLREAIATRETAMEAVEQSRRGTVPLSTEDYIAQKIIHGNAEADAHKYFYYNHWFGRFYMTEQTQAWMEENCAMTIKRPSLATLWRQWHKAVELTKASEAFKAEATTDRWGGDKINIISLEMIDAEIAAQRARDLYDRMLRTYEGRALPTLEQTANDRRSKPPPHPEPTPLSKIQNRRRRKSAQRAKFAGE